MNEMATKTGGNSVAELKRVMTEELGIAL